MFEQREHTAGEGVTRGLETGQDDLHGVVRDFGGAQRLVIDGGISEQAQGIGVRAATPLFGQAVAEVVQRSEAATDGLGGGALLVFGIGAAYRHLAPPEHRVPIVGGQLHDVADHGHGYLDREIGHQIKFAVGGKLIEDLADQRFGARFAIAERLG